MPEKREEGMMVASDVAKIAAIWLRVKAETSKPRPVAAVTYNNAATVSNRKSPLCGTPKTNTASMHNRKN